MKTNWVRILALSAIATAASWAQPAEAAHANANRAGGGASIAAVWDVAVTVVDCETGAVIRNIRSLQMYHADGTFSDTTSSGARGGGVGTWRQEGRSYAASYFFFRYNAEGSFASFAKTANTITLSPDGSQFIVKATVQDYDANNNLLSTGCVTQTAKKL